MAYFATVRRVLFHDTMAYGTHHFLTNFKFQCEAREHLFFGHVLDAAPADRAAYEDLVLLTHEAYSRNLAAVPVGDVVAVLLTIEPEGNSRFRFCFRAVRRDGTPVSCGFQTIVCLSKTSGEPVAVPASFEHFGTILRERLCMPSFTERTLSGLNMQGIFDEEAVALGIAVAREPGASRIVPNARDVPLRVGIRAPRRHHRAGAGHGAPRCPLRRSGPS